MQKKNQLYLQSSYKKASEMIPEWKEKFDLKAANELKESILAKDLRKTGNSSQKLSKKPVPIATSKNNTSVWAALSLAFNKYHKRYWILLDEKELSYDTTMKKLSDSLTRIIVNFEQEDFQQAWQSLDIFKKRLTSLRSICSKCHVDEWKKGSTSVKKFFVGDDMLAALQEIKKDFATGEPSEKVFKKNIRLYKKSVL